MRQIPAGLVSVAVFLSLLGIVGSNSPARLSEEISARAPTSKVSAVSFQNRLPLRGVSKAAESLLSALCGTLPGAVEENCDLSLKRYPGRVDVLIGIVPDPKHTHLGLFFDRTLEAIQQAAADQQYIFRRSYLPWEDHERSEPSALQERLKVEEYQLNLEQFPGALIFDRTQANGVSNCSAKTCSGRDILVILIVGERPTAGINRAQFRNAKIILDALYAARQKNPSPLRIFGPTFSGSLPSLNRLTQSTELSCKSGSVSSGNGSLHPQVSMVAFSGTITGASSQQAFTACRKDVVFSSFQTDDDSVIAAVQHFFIAHERHSIKQIAVLSEDETAYGSDPGTKSENSNANDSEPLQLYFPREISSLRSAYQEAQANTAKSKDAGQRTTLPLDLENTGADDDSIGVFSKKQLPLSQEAVLMDLVSKLRAKHINLILIRATDPLDQLFLTKYLREVYPQGRLVMMGSDSLFRREIQDSNLLGTLAVANYFDFPRQPGCKLSKFEWARDRIFPSSNSAGSYYAFRGLLNTLNEQLPTRLDLEKYTPRELCLDLASLGHDGYWRVARLSPEQKEAPIEHGRMPFGWRIFQTTVGLLALAFTIVLLRPSMFDPEESVAMMARVPGEGRTGVVATLSFLSIVIVWLSVWPNFVLGARTWSAMFVVIAGALFIVTASFDLFKRLRSLSFPIRIVLTALIPCATILVIWSTTKRPLSETKFLAMYRAVHLGSGLSLILPLILLCCAGWWWAFHTIAGSTLLDKRKTLLPRSTKWPADEAVQILQPVLKARAKAATGESLDLVTDCGGRVVTKKPTADPREQERLVPVFSVLHDHHAGLMNILRPNHLDARIIVTLLACLIGTAMVVQMRHPILSLEGSAYDQLLLIVTALAMIALIGATLRLRRIWLELRRLLISLDSVPFRRAFRRIRNMRCIELWRFGGDLADFRRAVARQYEALQAAVGTYLPGPDLESVEKVREKMFVAFRRTHDGNMDPAQGIGNNGYAGSLVKEFEKYQMEMANVARSVLMNLSEYWASDEGRRHGDRPNPDADAAEDFVALLYSNFLSIALTRVRSLVVAISGMYVFTLIALSLYPFEQRTVIRAAFTVILCFMFAVVAFVYSGIHRDTVISSLTNTKPGELGGMFWIKIFSFAALPVLSFAAAQFPELSNLLFSWLEPALQAFNR